MRAMEWLGGFGAQSWNSMQAQKNPALGAQGWQIWPGKVYKVFFLTRHFMTQSVELTDFNVMIWSAFSKVA